MIKEHRERKGLSQGEFARKLNVSQATVSDWENGKIIPRTLRLKSIASILGLDVNDLMKSVANDSTGLSPALSEPTTAYYGNVGQAQAHVLENYIDVPFLSARAQAGIPTISYEDCRMAWVDETYPVYATEDLKTKKSLVIEIIGDSMVPSINNGALVLARRISKADIRYESGGVYAVLFGSGRFVVKRIKTNTINSRGILTLWSDNETFGCIDVDANELHCMWKVIEKVKEIVY